MGDTTFPLFPTWADSSRNRTLEVLRKCVAMTKSGSAEALADGHGDRYYRGEEDISTFLTTLLDVHMAFEAALAEVFANSDGLAPGEVYQRFRQLQDWPIVHKYLELEYPHTPPSLQNVMVTTMQQLGYRSTGTPAGTGASTVPTHRRRATTRKLVISVRNYLAAPAVKCRAKKFTCTAQISLRNDPRLSKWPTG